MQSAEQSIIIDHYFLKYGRRKGFYKHLHTGFIQHMVIKNGLNINRQGQSVRCYSSHNINNFNSVECGAEVINKEVLKNYISIVSDDLINGLNKDSSNTGNLDNYIDSLLRRAFKY